MSVWFCIPSKRPPEQARPVLEAWRDMGYRIAVCRDEGDAGVYPYDLAHHFQGQRYPGYAVATNSLISAVLQEADWSKLGGDTRWCVIGGDDVWPDPNKRADEIARECEDHFGDLHDVPNHEPSTFGVMQPTGDPWADGQGRIIERIAGSAWIGREFALRAYGGNGPLWPEFWHMFGDEHLKCVAEKLGIYWMRRDLTQRHEHWARKAGATKEDMPDFLAKANSAAHWAESKAIFERLRDGGFSEAFDLLPARGGKVEP